MNEISKVRDHCWSYFAFHGEQRTKLFNYYLIVTTVIYAGVTSLVKDGPLAHPLMASILATSHCFICFIFHKLDRRHQDFVHIAERALKEIERGFETPLHRVFTEEDAFTKAAKKQAPVRGLLRGYLTCGDAFKYIYKGSFLVSFTFAGYFNYSAIKPFVKECPIFVI